MENMFLKASMKHDTLTENGAVSNSTTGKILIDQFGKAGNYRNRHVAEVFADQSALWGENPEMALRFPFYLRLVTRKVKVNNSFITEKVQKGQGARDEAFKRLLWVAAYQKDSFYKNLWLLPMVGSWKDLWTLLFYDADLGLGILDKKIFFTLMAQGILCDEQKELIKKFMPRIKSESKCTTAWTKTTNKLAKEFAKFLGWSERDYNEFKTSGVAHDFQKLICGKMFDKLNFSAIPGRALNLLVNSRFLKKHSLVEAYTEWISKQPIAKYTGYVYELGKQVINSRRGCILQPHVKMTLDKQFQSLIETAKKDGNILGNVWCALDTSGSMSWSGMNNGLTALDICMSLGVYFATLNEGAFHKHVIMFDNVSRVKELSGSFTDMLSQLPMNAMGGTNFQSVIDEIIRIRRENPSIPLSDYPQTLLVVSDMQFNSVGSVETNYEAMKRKLYTVFPQEFVDSMKFIWWDCTSRKNDFPTTMDDGGTYIFSGFDGAIITLLLGGEDKKETKVSPTMEEMVNMALSQEILQHISL